MGLIKLNPNKIRWDKKYCLYRGNSQGGFEMRIFNNLIKEKIPAYSGCDDEDEKLTFCNKEFYSSFFYAENLAKKAISSRRDHPFSHFPLILEINAQKYLDKLYRSNKGEGIVIKDGINLDDITVLYSTHIDLLEQRNPTLKLGKEIARQKIVLEQICEKIGFSREDLLTEFEKDQEKVLGYLCIRAYGYKIGEYNLEQKETVLKFLEIIRGKLRVIN